jgi:RNA polymerase sigma-70 factor (ECF subfamily)
LLERLRKAGPDAAEWQRLQDIYLPLIRSWLRRVPGTAEEVDDLSQEVLLVLFRELGSFERRRDGAFRAWLRQITLNRIRAFQKTRGRRWGIGGQEVGTLLANLSDPISDLAREWDEEHDQQVLNRLLALVKPDFQPHTWEAFTRSALPGEPVVRVARELGMSEVAVMQAKFRVLKRLRDETGELID